MTVVSLDMAYRSFLEVLAGSHPPQYAASLKPSSPRFTHSSLQEARPQAPQNQALHAQDQWQGRALHPNELTRMGLRSCLQHFRRTHSRTAAMASSLQLA